MRIYVYKVPPNQNETAGLVASRSKSGFSSGGAYIYINRSDPFFVEGYTFYLHIYNIYVIYLRGKLSGKTEKKYPI